MEVEDESGMIGLGRSGWGGDIGLGLGLGLGVEIPVPFLIVVGVVELGTLGVVGVVEWYKSC